MRIINNSFFGLSFEQVCKQFLVKNRFFSFTSLSRYWKGEEEIDVVSLNEEKKRFCFVNANGGAM
ncbi:MAG: DUF234 domain-containing protein [archaeon]|nr:DUF234 domain-containing protein [archaeon]